LVISISHPPLLPPFNSFQNLDHGIIPEYQEKFDNRNIENPAAFNPALTPFLKAECEQWRVGECIQICKAGKP